MPSCRSICTYIFNVGKSTRVFVTPIQKLPHSLHSIDRTSVLRGALRCF